MTAIGAVSMLFIESLLPMLSTPVCTTCNGTKEGTWFRDLTTYGP